MSMRIFYFFSVLLIFNFQSCYQSEPGVKIRISKLGLQYAANLGVDLLAKEIDSYNIPDFSGGNRLFSYSVTNIKVSKFIKPSAALKPLTGFGLSASLNNAVVELSFDWRYKLIGIRKSGTGTMKTKSISLSTNVKIERNANGMPTAEATACSCDISKLDITMNVMGFLSALTRLAANIAERKIDKKIEGKICEAVKKVINVDGRNRLATLNAEVRIDSNILLDYKLLARPVFTSEYVETSHVGEFLTSTGIRYNQISPPLTILVDGSRSVNMALMERLFNSAGYVLQRLGRLNKIFPINQAILLNLFNQPQGTSLQLKMEATEAPFINITTASFAINATAYIQVQTLGGGDLLNANVSLLLNCHAYFEGDRIKGSVLSIVPQVKIFYSSISSLTTVQLTDILTGLVQLAIPSLNERGAVGFQIPSLGGLRFVDPVLQRANGYARLGTNLLFL